MGTLLDQISDMAWPNRSTARAVELITGHDGGLARARTGVRAFEDDASLKQASTRYHVIAERSRALASA